MTERVEPHLPADAGDGLRAERIAPTSAEPRVRGDLLPFFIGIGGLLLIGFGFPLLNEGASGPCSALEYRVAAAVPMGDGRKPEDALASAFMRAIVGASGGSLAAALVKQRYPNLPPALGCTVAYWQTEFDPSILASLHNPGRPAP